MSDHSRRRFILGSCTAVATVAVAGCASDDGNGDSEADATETETETDETETETETGDGEGTGTEGDAPGRVDEFLTSEDAQLYEGEIEDLTGEDEVTVDVGAGEEGFAFDPPAFRADTGTTVVWEWTGQGGGHNVVPEGDTDFEDFGDEEIVEEEGHTIENTFDESGVGLYICQPHRSLGMVGAFIVE